MTFDVRFSATADEDLNRLFDFLLDRAETVDALDLIEKAIAAVRFAALTQLAATPTAFARPARVKRITTDWCRRA